MNKKDINIEEQTDCQNNVADMNEGVTEKAAADATDNSGDEAETEIPENTEEKVESGDESNNSSDSNESDEKSPLEKAQEQIDELKDKYLRSVAEFDNYRKRTLKERLN